MNRDRKTSIRMTAREEKAWRAAALKAGVKFSEALRAAMNEWAAKWNRSK